jgi:hypothetical protein
MGGRSNDETRMESALADPRLRRAFLELRERAASAPPAIRREIHKVLGSMDRGSTPSTETLARVLVWTMDTEFRKRSTRDRSSLKLPEVELPVVEDRTQENVDPAPAPVKKRPRRPARSSRAQGGFKFDEPEAPEPPRVKMVRESLGVSKSRTATDESGRRILRGDRRKP